MKDHTLIQAILDASHDGIIAVDQNSTVIWVNKNALEILGLPPHIVGEKITRYIPHSDMLRILATGKRRYRNRVEPPNHHQPFAHFHRR